MKDEWNVEQVCISLFASIQVFIVLSLRKYSLLTRKICFFFHNFTAFLLPHLKTPKKHDEESISMTISYKYNEFQIEPQYLSNMCNRL